MMSIVGALMGEAVLHRDADGAADGIEAEHRIVAEHRHVVDGDGRDEVPVDGVAEGFVDAHAVLVDGESPASARRLAMRRSRDRTRQCGSRCRRYRTE